MLQATRQRRWLMDLPLTVSPETRRPSAARFREDIERAETRYRYTLTMPVVPSEVMECFAGGGLPLDFQQSDGHQFTGPEFSTQQRITDSRKAVFSMWHRLVVANMLIPHTGSDGDDRKYACSPSPFDDPQTGETVAHVASLIN